MSKIATGVSELKNDVENKEKAYKEAMKAWEKEKEKASSSKTDKAVAPTKTDKAVAPTKTDKAVAPTKTDKVVEPPKTDKDDLEGNKPGSGSGAGHELSPDLIPLGKSSEENNPIENPQDRKHIYIRNGTPVSQ